MNRILKKTKRGIYFQTDHSEQSSMLEVWVELHQSWLCARLPLNKTTKEKKIRNVQCSTILGMQYFCTELKHINMKYNHIYKSTNHGKSSKMGLVLVLNTAIIGGLAAACGSPERTDLTGPQNINIGQDEILKLILNKINIILI